MWQIIIVALVLIDQISKFLIKNNMELGQQIILISDIFNIRYVLNKGAAFSLLENSQFLFISLTFVIVIIILARILSEYKKGHDVIAKAILLAGALGNLIDRLIFGYVRDFLEVPFFAIMNFADCFIFIGVILIIIKYIFLYRMHRD